jgi:hypothetical protein
MELESQKIDISMVGIVEATQKKWYRLPIFQLYNIFLQTNGITLDAIPFLSMLTTLKSTI